MAAETTVLRGELTSLAAKVDRLEAALAEAGRENWKLKEGFRGLEKANDVLMERLDFLILTPSTTTTTTLIHS